MRLLFYMTPVLYPSTRVIDALDEHEGLAWVEHLYFLNPFVAVIDLYRCGAVGADEFPGWDNIGISLAVSARPRSSSASRSSGASRAPS